MSYSESFDFGSGPSLKSQNVKGWGLTYEGRTAPVMGLKTFAINTLKNGQQDAKAAKAFDAIMAGHDAASQAYINQLTGIYNGYQKYAEEFGDSAKPIMEALTGDIGEMQGYIKDYGNVLDEVRPTMMDGIRVDPNATRTREEYQGNAAAAYGKQKDQAAQQMAAQGLNPYANKGASRDMALSQAAAMTDAGNKAYKDWREGYNRDIGTKAALQGQYAGLVGQKGALQGQVMQARGGLIDANKSIMDAKISAGQAQAAGLSDLLSLQENRRQEALSLAQQQQENARYQDDMKQQLNAKLTASDKRWGGY